jgi:hypothetical protein
MSFFSHVSSNKINQISSALAESVHLSIKHFPIQVPETDDTARIQRAINSFPSAGGVLEFDSDNYYISSTITLKSGITLEGRGWQSTLIKRTANVVGFASIGTSILAPNPAQNVNIRLKGIRFHGGDFSSDLFQFQANSFVFVNECRFSSCTGRAILAQELFDSRFFNCYFDWIGSTDGTIPGIDLKSGSGYEYTNQIHFVGCDFESYRGTALQTTGVNTNEIFLTDCKFESGQSVVPHVIFDNAYTVFLDNVTFTSNGVSGQTIPKVLHIKNTTRVYGIIFMEHLNTASLTNFIYIEQSASVDLLAFFGGGVDTLTDAYCIKTDGNNSYTHSLKGYITGSNPNNKKISNISYDRVNRQIFVREYGEPNVIFSNYQVNGNDQWYLGRVVSDGASTKFRMIRNLTGTETTIYEINNANEVHFKTNTFLDNSALHFAQLSTQPWGREGSFYTDTSVTPNAQRTYSNGAWRRIAYGSDPTTATGSWAKGDIMYNTNPVKSGKIGWVRLTSGTGQVLNTDWQPFGAIDA